MSDSVDQVEGSEEESAPPTENSSKSEAATNPGASSNEISSEVSGAANMGLIMDIPVTVSMELGRTRLSIRELLSMNPGSVIEFQRLATEPMEVLVNGTLVAHGEAVRVGEKIGVRLTNIISAGERLEKINGL